MAYIDPKLDWDEDYEPSPGDMNRIEGNIKNIKSETTTISGVKTFSQEIQAPSGVAGNLTGNVTGNLSGDATGTTHTATSSIVTNTVNERTSGNGVTIDGMNIRDGGINGNTTITGNVVITGGVAVDTVVNDLSVQGSFVPEEYLFDNGTNGTLSFSAVPRGIYHVYASFFGAGTVTIQNNINGVWVTQASFSSASGSTTDSVVVFSDGTNTRIQGSGALLYARKY